MLLRSLLAQAQISPLLVVFVMIAWAIFAVMAADYWRGRRK